MISTATAVSLKQAGLNWQPAILDCFAITNRDLDDKVFVISDVLVTVEMLQEMQVVSFQGASEWALDYLVTSEVTWIPSEEQLRKLLEAALIAEGNLSSRLTSRISSCVCEIVYRGQRLAFEAAEAGEAYASALLYLFEQKEKE